MHAQKAGAKYRDWVTFPHHDNPKSEVVPVLIVKQFNPERQYTIKYSKVLAVHKATGYTAKALAWAVRSMSVTYGRSR